MPYPNYKICYFPGRESSYVRNRVLIAGLRQAGCEVFDCSYGKKTIWRYFIGFSRFLKYKKDCDFILVGFFGQFLVPIVRLFTRKRIMFDAFLSAYQTLAYDRRSIKPQGVVANIIRMVEKRSCALADLVLLDTNQHIDYFVNEYKLNRNLFRRSILGADDRMSAEQPSEIKDPFLVHFHGEFQALHGVNYIVKAAKLLPHVQFRMIGQGQQLKECLALARHMEITNIEFIPFVPFDQIPRYIAEASVCLGIFGPTHKTQLVIPFKVYEGIVMGKAVITADTPAIHELFTNKENILLCQAADPKSLAEAIEMLRLDETLRKTIAANGRMVFQEKCSPLSIGREIVHNAQDMFN